MFTFRRELRLKGTLSSQSLIPPFLTGVNSNHIPHISKNTFMSNENQPTPDRIWKQYQFVFQNTNTVDGDLSASIREKIASLQLQKEPLNVRYEKVGEEPLQVDIYIEETVDRYYNAGLLKPREERIFSLSDEASKMPAFAPAEANAAGDASLAAVAATTLDETAPGSVDDSEVESVTFRGAVRNPPPATEPLP